MYSRTFGSGDPIRSKDTGVRFARTPAPELGKAFGDWNKITVKEKNAKTGKTVKKRVANEGLTKRRKSEADMFLDNKYDSKH